MTRIEKSDCSCGGKYGRFHKPPCDLEECPFCHEQLISCGCCYILLGIDSSKEPVYSQGLDEKQQEEWDKLLRKKGLVRVGSEVRYRAAENWTDAKRKETIAAIADEMSSAVAKGKIIDAARVKRWSERLNALTNASPVFLEMNQNHILRGSPVEWTPPSK